MDAEDAVYPGRTRQKASMNGSLYVEEQENMSSKESTIFQAVFQL